MLGSRAFSDAAIDKVVVVRPADVAWYQDVRKIASPGIAPYRGYREEFLISNAGRVVSGDWDTQRVAIEESEIYRLLYDRFIRGVPWEEVPVYRAFASRVESGARAWHSRSVRELRQRAEYVDSLHASLARWGYEPNPELQNPLDPIALNIGRRGELLFCNTGGHHRLVLARLVGLDTISARVFIRHEQWQRRREQLRARRTRGSSDPHDGLDPIHPDLADLVTGPQQPP